MTLVHDTRNTAQSKKPSFSVAQPRDDRSAERGTPTAEQPARNRNTEGARRYRESLKAAAAGANIVVSVRGYRPSRQTHGDDRDAAFNRIEDPCFTEADEALLDAKLLPAFEAAILMKPCKALAGCR